MGDKDGEEKKKKNPVAPKLAGKRKRKKGAAASVKVPQIFPTSKCKLRLLKLERVKDFLLMEQEFIQNQEIRRPREEQNETEKNKVEEIRSTPLSVGTLEELIDDNHAIVSTAHGPEYYVTIMSFVNQDLLEPGCSVLLHNKVHAIVGILADDQDPMVSVMKVEKAPLESYADIGGLETQIQEIKEAVELPLTHPELYEEIGIRPPKGVVLYGEPGTGKTLLAKAVANQTSATFLRVVGSELIQKYLGDGPKLVRELFRVADDLSPSIVFIDEVRCTSCWTVRTTRHPPLTFLALSLRPRPRQVDAIGSKRYDSSSSGTREIQRTMIELLNQLDGFDERSDVKVMMMFPPFPFPLPRSSLPHLSPSPRLPYSTPLSLS
jgi:26S proteasome regulatory subunit T2